jgi:hypothetical protein
MFLVYCGRVCQFLRCRRARGRRKKTTTYNILTSLFRNSKKKPVWMPKTTNEAANAVTKATRLIPVASWADPGPSSMVVVVAAAAADVSVDDANDDNDGDADVDTSAGAVVVMSLIDTNVACDTCR